MPGLRAGGGRGGGGAPQGPAHRRALPSAAGLAQRRRLRLPSGQDEERRLRQRDSQPQALITELRLTSVADPDFYSSRIPDPTTAPKEKGEKIFVLPFYVATVSYNCK
jgi:hypothetical protein